MIAVQPIPAGQHSKAGDRAGNAALSSTRPCRVVFAGGGTGGHLFPGIAMAREFQVRNAGTRILFVSSANAFERQVLGREGFELKRVRAAAFKGKRRWRQMMALGTVPLGVCGSLGIMMRFNPEVVIGLGSYSAAPVVLAARLRRIPIVLHEQNILPGITNRILARFADRICISFDRTLESLPGARVEITGNPVRAEFLESRPPVGPTRAGRNGGSPGLTVLIIGGSQGAHGINAALIEALDHLPHREQFWFVHQTGPSDLAAVRAAYGDGGVTAEVEAFFVDMADRYRQADLVICRAGATTVAELKVLGKPALFIPFPYAADNHQALNAQSLVDAGAAEMILQQDLTGKALAARLDAFRRHPDRLADMAAKAADAGRGNAARAIVDICYDVMGRK